MSDNQTNLPQNEQPESSATPVAQMPAIAAAQTQADTKQPENMATNERPIVIEQKGGSGKGLATGALVLSLLALGCGGFLFVQGQNVLKNQELKFGSELDKAALGNSENGVLLQNALMKQDALNAQVAALSKSQDEQTRRLDSVNAAYAELLKGRVNWLVDEVEVTLNVASQQLLLSGNVPVAVGVLENVEQRLTRFEQPELLLIKQAISQDLVALKERPYLNVSATTLRIDRLQSAVASLPLMVDDTLKRQNAPEPVSQTGSFWQRTWENTVGMVKGMVEVRRLESTDQMLLAPEQIYFVRENLRLRLLDARLALLQHNGEVYQGDLNAVEATIKQYFDVNSPNTQAWLKELNELKSLEVRMVSDDALKNSLAAVRNYQNNARTALPVVLPENTVASTPSSAAVVAPSVAANQAISAASNPMTDTASAPKTASAPSPKSASTPAAKPATQPAGKPASAPAKSEEKAA
ncbi:uroporphyrinogen-III C-methyltransferase [Neisseriaceae bacterium B1]